LDLRPAALDEARVWERLAEAVAEGWKAEGHGEVRCEYMILVNLNRICWTRLLNAIGSSSV
jgi:hypothetical protein